MVEKYVKKYAFSLIVYILVFIGLATYLANSIEYGLGVIFASLLVSNTLAVFVVSMYMSYRYGFDIIHIILMVIIYVISVYVVYNDSAMIYVYFYPVVDLIGFGVGRLIRKSKKVNE